MSAGTLIILVSFLLILKFLVFTSVGMMSFGRLPIY